MASTSLAWPDPFRAAAYQLEIIEEDSLTNQEIDTNNVLKIFMFMNYSRPL